MAMIPMSLGNLEGSAALLAGVPIVSTLLAGDLARVSTPAGHYFSIYHYYRLAPEFCAACCPEP